jgi:hypothetical protein
MALPFANDIRRIHLENFDLLKQFRPNEEQLGLVDELIDAMDLTSGKNRDDQNEANSDVEEEELYNPHTTFNPYIQRKLCF